MRVKPERLFVGLGVGVTLSFVVGGKLLETYGAVPAFLGIAVILGAGLIWARR